MTVWMFACVYVWVTVLTARMHDMAVQMLSSSSISECTNVMKICIMRVTNVTA